MIWLVLLWPYALILRWAVREVKREREVMELRHRELVARVNDTEELSGDIVRRVRVLEEWYETSRVFTR